jgi:Flp pilus assembly protein TadG
MRLAAQVRRHGRRRSVFHLFRLLRDDREGTAVIEFALIAVPFLMLLFALFETAFLYFMNQHLDNAVQLAARRIATGQYTNANADKDKIKLFICNQIVFLIDCPSAVKVDVSKLEEFDRPKAPIVDGRFDDSKFGFEAGGAGEVTLLRAAFEYKIFTPFVSMGSAALSNGKILIMSTAAFRTEPIAGETIFERKGS